MRRRRATFRGPGKLWAKEGDAVAAMQSAATVMEAEYRNDLVYHAQMEPLNAVAAVSPDGGACELWCGVQSKTIAVTVAADALKIAPDKIIYHDMLMGGGFGRRGHRDEEYVHDAVVLSNAVKKPVKVMWTREDDVHNGRFNPLSAHYLARRLRRVGQARRLPSPQGHRRGDGIPGPGAVRTGERP